MKKIMSDKSFWLILSISIISLIVLTVGVVFLTRKNTKEFYSAGYIINSSASKFDKYYFSNDTVYKENVFDEYVFKDIEGNEVSTRKDNFIHYLDNSLSFMKNGVILDLDNFNESIVPYYNITDKSIVKYNNGGYYIETADKTLVFGNFLGRITENKYIVVGSDISVKLAGNDTSVEGDYFEILFVENGIVKVENQEGSYQTISDGTVIYVGDNIKINLGDKSVVYGEEVKLSLSELTIDGNENIDIVPEGVVDKEKEETNDTTGNGTDNDTNKEQGALDNDADNDEKITTVLKKEVSVSLIEASSDVNTISAKFQIIDTADAIKGNLVLTVVNTTTGDTVYTKMLVNSPEEQSVVISSLASDCNYVMTIIDENNENNIQYFQKSFRTDSLNLRLRREMVTENSLTYSLDFGVNSDVVAADVTIFDVEGNELGSYTVENGTDDKITFEGLTNNTLYKVVVDNVVIKNIQYDKLYTSETSDMTLKSKPTLGNVSVKTNNDTKSFTLMMDNVIDDDKAIVKYTYQIFKSEDLSEDTMTTAIPVYSFSRNELNEEILKLDESKNLFGNTDYKFKIVAQYYDNYRYNEIETILSSSFNVVGKATITFEEDEIDFNRISGTVIIDDIDCTIPFEGRKCNDASNNFVIRYYGGTTSIRNTIENVVVDSENQTLYFDLNGLQENTLYTFEVFANVDLHNDVGIQEGQYIGGFNVSTTGISALMMQNWKKNGYSFENPISVNTEMVSTTSDNDSIDKLASITFNLYTGDVSNSIDFSTPIASYTVSENVLEQFYNKSFSINSSSFMYTDSETSEVFNIESLEVLKKLSGGRLSKYYTIEITDAFDETGTNEFAIMNNLYVYQTPSILLLEDEVSAPEIIVEEITNVQTKSNEFKDNFDISHISSLDDEIVRGYKVTAIFDKAKIENFAGYGSINSINFYVNDSKGNLIEEKKIDFISQEEYTVYFFLGQGTDYDIYDNDMRRGNTYTFSFDLSIDDDSDPLTDDLVFPASRPVSDNITAIKQEPSFKLYIDNSSESSITYKYVVYDYDNTLYKDIEDNKYYMYYNYDETLEDSKVEIVKDGSLDTLTLSGLSNGNIYDISYYRAISKSSIPSEITIGEYYFDGYYDGSNYNLGYELGYGNFDNRLKIKVNNNEFLNRASAYLVTLEASGDKYQTIVTNLVKCNDNNVTEEETNNCIIIDYKDIASFKGKNIKVTLDVFYDSGYVGFGQSSKLGGYFEKLGLVDSKNSSKVGFIYQTTGTTQAGEYFYVDGTGYSSTSDTPKGILSFELINTDNFKEVWKLNTSNVIDSSSNKFSSYGNIVFNNSNVIAAVGSVNIIGSNLTINPKVLDKVTVESEDNVFKFTSITPKVKVEKVSPLINGATMNIDLSIDPDTLSTDFVATHGKYKFYIDIYQKTSCTEDDGEGCIEEKKLVKTIETDYDNLSKVTFIGLDPNTRYYYKIAADMNKNGSKVKTQLFDYNRTGYVEFESQFSTLNKDEIFNRITYGYTSSITNEIYNNRMLTITAFLKTNVNFNLKYQIYDVNGNLEFEHDLSNENIVVNGETITAKYIENITGNNFVFGAGYHNLVITAITTDLNRELELYNDKLVYDSQNGKNFHELNDPTFKLNQNADINKNGEDYDYSITYNINVTDVDKVISNGIYHIELQNSAYDNACGNVNDCRATINIKENTCSFDNGKTSGCSIISKTADSQEIAITFNGLIPDTNYVIYIYADTYRNNLSLAEKEGLVYVRKSQYTKSPLNFSLGAVTPTAVSKNNLVITFAGAANLTDSLKGIDYNITVQGGGKVASGSLGRTDTTNGKLTFGLDADKYPTISIPIPSDKQLGLNNYIIITYYYEDNKGNLVKLKIGENTSYQYTVKNES